MGHQDLANWAQFSNDHNPIHFDLAAAKKANLDTIVAHGKLALLSVKAGVNHQLSSENDQWYHFRATFRSPVKCDIPVTLNLQQKRGGTRFNLLEVASQSSCIKGSINTADVHNIDQVITTGHLTSHEVQQRSALFLKLFPYCTADWITLESMLFSRLVEQHLDDVLESSSSTKIIKLNPGSEADDGINYVMQTSQETFFDPTLVSHSLARSWPDNAELTYQLGNPICYTSDGSDLCSVDIGLSINGELRMLTRYGFIII